MPVRAASISTSQKSALVLSPVLGTPVLVDGVCGVGSGLPVGSGEGLGLGDGSGSSSAHWAVNV